MIDDTIESEQIEEASAESYEMVAYRAPRGAWDFTEAQRIALSFLIWLNIIVFVVGYLTITGQVSL